MQSRLICVPGLPGDARTFGELFSRLPSGMSYRVVEQPEVRAFSAVDDWLAEADHRLQAVVADAGGARVLLLGMSLGGYFAARWLARGGLGVDAAVLVSAFATIPGEMAAGRRALADSLETGTTSMAELLVMLDASCGDREERTPAANAIVFETLRLLSSADWVLALRHTARLEDRAYAVGAFSTPATVIHARSDRAVPLAAGEELAKLGSRVEVSTVESTSHILPLTHPDRVMAAITKHLE